MDPQSAVAPDEGACVGVELTHTFRSPEALADAFLAALAEDDLDELLRFALHEVEFACHVWPYLPASRPERGLTLDFVWGDLNQKSLNALAYTRHNYGGRRLALQRVSFAGRTTDYGPFAVHADTRLTVSDGQGRTGTLSLFGSIMESRGRFKLFSYVTD
jgi:hypothetical protein